VVPEYEGAVELDEGTENCSINKLHDGEQFLGTVLDGLASQREAVGHVSGQLLQHLGPSRPHALDLGGLVRDHEVRYGHPVGEQFDIVPYGVVVADVVTITTCVFVLEEALFLGAVDDLAGRTRPPSYLVQPLELDRVGAEDESGADMALRSQ
jgi:hypothetical protein